LSSTAAGMDLICGLLLPLAPDVKGKKTRGATEEIAGSAFFA
jgi:hypothetical protein